MLQQAGLLLALLPALAACRSSEASRAARPMDPADVPAVLSEAQAVLSQGDAVSLDELEDAVDDLRSARVTGGLEPEVRQSVRLALERGAEDLIRRGEDPDALRDLVESELPMRLASRAGVRAAEILYADGERMKAFRALRALDRRYPSHTQRREAGDLLADIGFELADDTGRYFLVFRYAALAPQVLEYLALEYPTHEETDDALARLALIYENSRLWRLAIVKLEELILWVPSSPLRAQAEADIPRLRLAAMKSPHYGRDELLRARDELLRWLEDHPASNDLRANVERNLVDARQRLADNDLKAADFYRTVGSPAGIRFHALRALGDARLAGNEQQVEEAEALLASAVDIPDPVPVDIEDDAEPSEQGPRDVFNTGAGLEGSAR